MSDLYVDYDMLLRTRDSLRRMQRLMEKPGRDMEQVDGAAMGVYNLAKKMDDFGDEWSYGIKQLTKFSDAAAEALDSIKESFDQTDNRLAEAIEKDGEPPRYIQT